MLHRSTAIIICDGAYPPRPAAGICCRSFSYAYFLSGTSLLLCLTHISRFAALRRYGVAEAADVVAASHIAVGEADKDRVVAIYSRHDIESER